MRFHGKQREAMGEMAMAEIERIQVDQAHQRVQNGQTLLVCAYTEEEKCNQMMLEGALNMAELERRLPSLRKEQELVFYCG
jgi:hypothetical protein